MRQAWGGEAAPKSRRRQDLPVVGVNAWYHLTNFASSLTEHPERKDLPGLVFESCPSFGLLVLGEDHLGGEQTGFAEKIVGPWDMMGQMGVVGSNGF